MSEHTWILGLISPILVLIGWKVVYFNARKIATRSENKSITDSLLKVITEISESAISYWLPSSSAKDKQLYVLTISAKMSQVQHFFKILKRRGASLDSERLSLISDKVTLDSEYLDTFTDVQRQVRAHEIMEICMSSVEHIYAEFEKQHPPVLDIIPYQFFHWIEPSPAPSWGVAIQVGEETAENSSQNRRKA